jgi:hypothetical protein
VRGLALNGGSKSGRDTEDPTAVYGRGLRLDGTSILKFGNFNMGQDWTFSIWMCPYHFNTLFSIVDNRSANVLTVSDTVIDGQ